MAEDGTGGVVYLKRVDGVTHVFVARYAGGRWLAPIRVDTEEPFAASWPRIGAANDGELIVVWATPFATREGKPVYELLGSELGPGGESFGPPILIDSERSKKRPAPARTSRSARADRRTWSTGSSSRSRRTSPCCGPATWSSRSASRTSTASAGRTSGRSTATPRPRCARPTERNAPAIAIGPTGNGDRRVAGAGRRRRRADLGAATVRQLRRLRDAGQRDDATTGSRSATDADAPSVGLLPPGTGRGGLPPAGRRRLAASRAAHLPQRPPRRRIGQRSRVRRRQGRRPGASAGARRQSWARRASTSTNSRGCACSTTATARRG